jgi:hypothetical protein
MRKLLPTFGCMLALSPATFTAHTDADAGG